MFAYIHHVLPLVPVFMLAAGALALVAAFCTSGGGGKKKAQIADLKARVEALERKS
jgi:hypothetical protein